MVLVQPRIVERGQKDYLLVGKQKGVIMKKLAVSSINQILYWIYQICRAFVIWYQSRNDE